MSSAVTDIIATANHLQVVRYTQVASMAVLIIEWFLVIGEEVEYIWRAPWTFIKVLYLLSRYTPFLDTPFDLIIYLHPRISSEECQISYKIATASTFIGMTISECILVARTYAIYGLSRTVGVTLGIGVVISTIVGSITLAIYEGSLVFGPAPSPAIPGCFLRKSNNIVFFNFVILLCWEFLIVILTTYKGIRVLRISRVPTMEILYRDGIVFFFVLLILSSANIAVFLAAPPEYLDLLDTLTRCLHSIVCCRVLLNLRAAAHLSDNTTSISQLRSDIDFAGVFEAQENRDDPIFSTVGSYAMHDMSVSTRDS
ncbi:hypothetical protein OE88DRAFT_1661137 [Heliocybe sulcata]|uniref:DUF6533 domain-containing protein n=1 Tax=Heliocybe sulcata TaxID=5364 RepID=A0A5C3MZJ6_9AGAM|nr:hypothetical protein OE88DRAFT_1661137 [Heliocybe sulcata]